MRKGKVYRLHLPLPSLVVAMRILPLLERNEQILNESVFLPVSILFKKTSLHKSTLSSLHFKSVPVTEIGTHQKCAHKNGGKFKMSSNSVRHSF